MNRLKISKKRGYLIAVSAFCLLDVTAAHAGSTYVNSKMNADDWGKIYLSTTNPNTIPLPAQAEGLQFGTSLGWGSTHVNTLFLPQNPSTGRNFHDYWINIWVQDIGGGGPDLLGQFTLTGAPGNGSPIIGAVNGCRFDNGTVTMLTNTTQWSVTKPQPQSISSLPNPAGYPVWTSNYLPPFVAPSQIPFSLGANGVSPWGLRSGINAAAKWITTASPYVSYTEAWFSTHIRCP
ncbi:MAG: hypothetical protein ABL933_03620 [Methyloglobulus sp.]|nr:hypothetical protein [Methyloglobulus sp.]